MTDLGPEGRALLRAAHGADDDEMLAARERVRGPLGRRVGAAAIGVTATTVAATAQAAGSSSVGLGLLGKVVIGLAAFGVVAGGVAVSRSIPPAAPTAVVAISATKTEAPAAVIAPPPIALAPPVAEPATTPSAPAPPPASVSVTTTAAPLAKLSPTKSAAPAPSSLTAEITALRSANDALAAGRASEALAILDATPSTGTFGEERTALRLLARCMLDAPAARSAATQFLEAHPSSPFASRLRKSCSIP